MPRELIAKIPLVHEQKKKNKKKKKEPPIPPHPVFISHITITAVTSSTSECPSKHKKPKASQTGIPTYIKKR
jgi:hypothetical protein